MCGSGTFAIEAALMAADTAPGLLRYKGYRPATVVSGGGGRGKGGRDSDRGSSSRDSRDSSSRDRGSSSRDSSSVSRDRGSKSGGSYDLESLMEDPSEHLDRASGSYYQNTQNSHSDTEFDLHSNTRNSNTHTDSSFTPYSALPCPLRWTDLSYTATPAFDAAWESALVADKRSALNVPGSPPIVLANDLHPGAIKLAIEGAGAAGVHRMIKFSCGDAALFHPPAPLVVISNPPWDLRLNEGAEEAWEKLDVFCENIKARVPVEVGSAAEEAGAGGGKAWVSEVKGAGRRPVMWTLTGNEALARKLRTRPSSTVSVRAAATDMLFSKYVLK
ncbi:hypothetical protein B484DRAFT_456554 [Ochromonadaceae sp. CCMP2298]|nr:hypothetical protein B484DRAFT_456554 [Ochromonadaceae sp. CCMP2298]